MLTTLLLNSCALFEKDKDEVNLWIKYEKAQKKNEEYLNHLSELGNHYLNTPGIKVVRISKSSKKFLEEIYQKIIKNNEIYIKNIYSPEFYIIKDQAPFIFSLPGVKVFLSTGLINKYLKNESLLIAAVGIEIVKSSMKAYENKVIVPVGYIVTNKIISMTKVPLKIKSEINKWTYLILKRANYDASAMLNWIQAQNKNVLDFSYMVSSAKQSSEEEFLFKNFLVKENEGEFEEFQIANSSRGFYKLIKEVRRSLD
ncbi:MAG: hypothetical protein GY909_11360 [Oligoflexia bacterium]|nr:hypothetical protein [Oligoflexia bacterium]